MAEPVRIRDLSSAGGVDPPIRKFHSTEELRLYFEDLDKKRAKEAAEA